MISFSYFKLLTLLILIGALYRTVAFPAIAAAIEPGLQGRNDIVLYEDFEAVDWAKRWEIKRTDGTQDRRTDPAHVFDGQASLRIENPATNSQSDNTRVHYFNGTSATQGRTTPGTKGYNQLFMRWYMKIEPGSYFEAAHYGNGMKGNSLYGWPVGKPFPPLVNGSPQTPNGTNLFSHRASFRGGQGPHIYTYTAHGNTTFEQNPPEVKFQPNRWTCVEIQLTANTVGQKNGQLRLWMDGVLKSQRTDIEFRTIPSMQIQAVYNIYRSIDGSRTVRWEDNLVVAENLVGCKGSGPSTPTPTSTGTPNSCLGDVDQDHQVNVQDLLRVLSDWGTTFGTQTLMQVLQGWGQCV